MNAKSTSNHPSRVITTRTLKFKLISPKTNSKTRLLLLVTVVLALLLSACGELTPTNDGSATQLLINEVFTGSKTAGSQWIELLNNTDDSLPIAGYKINTTHGVIDLGTLTANYSTGTFKNGVMSKGSLLIIANYPQLINGEIAKLIRDNARDDQAAATAPVPPAGVEERKVLGQLDPNKDLIALVDGTNNVVDQVGWGGPDKTALNLPTDINLNLPATHNDNDSLGRTPHFNQRPATDPGHINPGVFTVHNTPTPGTNTTPRAKVTFNFLFSSFTDIVTTLGAIILWLAFIIVAFVAQRFETLSEQKTYWQYLAVAPLGILLYAIIQVQDFIRTGTLEDFWSWPAFLALFASGVACVYVINIFRLIAKNILQAE